MATSRVAEFPAITGNRHDAGGGQRRAGIGSGPHAYTLADAIHHTYPYQHSHEHADAQPDALPNAYPDADRDTDANADRNLLTDAYSNQTSCHAHSTDRYTDSGADCCAAYSNRARRRSSVCGEGYL